MLMLKGRIYYVDICLYCIFTLYSRPCYSDFMKCLHTAFFLHTSKYFGGWQWGFWTWYSDGSSVPLWFAVSVYDVFIGNYQFMQKVNCYLQYLFQWWFKTIQLVVLWYSFFCLFVLFCFVFVFVFLFCFVLLFFPFTLLCVVGRVDFFLGKKCFSLLRSS